MKKSEIARMIGVDRSTVWREIKRNRTPHRYNPSRAILLHATHSPVYNRTSLNLFELLERENALSERLDISSETSTVNVEKK